MCFTFKNHTCVFVTTSTAFKNVVRLTVGDPMFSPECLVFNGIGSVWLKATKLLLNPRIHFTFEICSIFDYQGVFNDFVLSPWLGISLFHFLKAGCHRIVQYTLSHACVLSCFSCVWLFATPWTVAHQAPLSMGFSRQEHWRGLPCPSPAQPTSYGASHVARVVRNPPASVGDMRDAGSISG